MTLWLVSKAQWQAQLSLGGEQRGGRGEGRREGMRWVLEWRGEQLASKKK